MTFIRQLARPREDCASPAEFGLRQLHLTGEFMQVPDCRGKNFPEARIAYSLQFAQNRFSGLFLVFDDHFAYRIRKYRCSIDIMMLSFSGLYTNPKRALPGKQP